MVDGDDPNCDVVQDVNAMAHDLKRNVWQKTPGEIKRA
jgi:hypothetical protein